MTDRQPALAGRNATKRGVRYSSGRKVGQFETIKDAENKITTYYYNLLGQRTNTILPDSSTKTMTYNPAGRLLKATLGSNKSQTNVFEFSGVPDKVEYRNLFNALVGTDDYSYDAVLRRIGSTGYLRGLRFTRWRVGLVFN